MAPRPLTLKYRPQVFADLVGQDHVTSVLTAALESGRVAQAFLFTGARGVGKTTSARILAKALNCENRSRPETGGRTATTAAGGREGSKAEPCGVCTSCVEIAAGVSLDVLEIDGASNRGIADVQALRENVRFAPTGGRHRVVIIDEVHQLSGDAFAALLKTLEEPPAHLVFIFATTDPQKLPDTIRSRTQRFDFARVSIRRVADRLLEIRKREAADPEGVKFELTDGAALLIAHKGEGSMRDAVSALDQVVSAGEASIDETLVRRVLGIPDREAYFRIGGAVLARDPQAALQQLHAAFEKGLDPRELAEGLAEHFRNVLVLKVDPERGHDLVPASNEDLVRLKQAGEGWADTDLLRLMRLATECQWPMRDSPQPLVHLEAAVMQMATIEPAETVAALIERLEALEKRLAGGGSVTAAAGAARAAAAPGARPHGFAVPAAQVTPAAPSARVAPSSPSTPATSEPARPPATATPPPAYTAPRASEPVGPTLGAPSRADSSAATAVADDITLDEGLADAWKRTIARVNERKRMLGAFLEEIRLVGVAGDAVVLAMDDLHRSVIDSTEHRPIVREELARVFGRPLEFRCTPGTPDTPAQRAAKADDLKPMIERAMEVFDGEVIDRAPRGGDRSA
jgi:DNA polymerase-3 subunit gamma/tau